MKDPLIGNLLDEKYRIERMLGKGGMATVYLATQEPLGRKVAVKVLRHTSTDASVREIDEKRFFREASLASKLTHPNTVIIHDFGVLEDDLGLFLVMEFLDGSSLGDLIRRVGHLSWDVAKPILKQVGGSLEEAHNRGLIHRDLKPLNIMVSQNVGVPISAKVLDFGLAKPMEEAESEQVTVKGAIIGSPLYMSPEQIFNEDVDHRSDIYSLGIVAYEMLVGRPPFVLGKDGHVRDLLKSHLTGTIPEMRSLNPHLDTPSQAEFAIRRCLAKKSKDRFESVADFIAAIDSDISSERESFVQDTADFTHHRLVDRRGKGRAAVSRDESLAVSTRRVGSEDDVIPPTRGTRPSPKWRSPLAASLLLVVGMGLAFLLSSSPEAPESERSAGALNEVPMERQSGVDKTAVEISERPNIPAEKPDLDVSNQSPPQLAKEPTGEASSSKVEVTFESEPSGAMVWQGDKAVSRKTTPFQMTLLRANMATAFEFRKRGYESVQRKVSGEFDGNEVTIRSQLKRSKRARARKVRPNPLRRRER